jgi:hypothetical protein
MNIKCCDEIYCFLPLVFNFMFCNSTAVSELLALYCFHAMAYESVLHSVHIILISKSTGLNSNLVILLLMVGEPFNELATLSC